MEFTNRFHVPLPLEDAWVLMLDVPRILPCLPGARLTGDSGDGKYSGSVTLRLGPIKLAFDGQAELLRQDDAAHIAWLRGSGAIPRARRGQLGVQLRARAGGGRHRCRGDDPAGTVRLGGAVWPGQRHDHRGRRADPGGVRAQSERHADTGAGGAAVVTIAGDERPGGAAADAGGASPREATAPGFDAGHGSPQAQALLFQAQAVLAQAQAVLAQVQSRGSPAGRGEPRPSAELNMLSIGLRAVWARIGYGISRLFGRGDEPASDGRGRDQPGRVRRDGRGDGATPMRGSRASVSETSCCAAASNDSSCCGMYSHFRARHGVAGLECRRSATHDAPGTFRPAARPRAHRDRPPPGRAGRRGRRRHSRTSS